MAYQLEEINRKLRTDPAAFVAASGRRIRLTTAMRQKYQDHLAAQRAEETANETASRALARLRALAHF